MTKLILIRHPETEWSKQKKFQGVADIALTSKGKKHAGLISDYLKDEKISAIYSSKLKRAHETATIIAKPHLLEIKKDPRLNEISFGRWEGKTFDQIQKENPQLAQNYLDDPLNTEIPESESVLDFNKRVTAALKDILTQDKSIVVIVSHSGVNRIIICNLLDLSLSYFWRIKQDLGAINIVEVHENTSVVSSINGTLWAN